MKGIDRDKRGVYGKVHASFWSSPTIRALSEGGRTLALYLMTCQHKTIAGAFRMPDGYAADDLGWDALRVAEGFAELSANGFATRCERTKWVLIERHLAWNQPENPNQRSAVRKVLALVPDECDWKARFLNSLDAELNPSLTVAKAFANQYSATSNSNTGTEEKEWAATLRVSAPSVPVAGSGRPPECTFDEWTQRRAELGQPPHPTDQQFREIAAEFGDHEELVRAAWVAFIDKKAGDQPDGKPVKYRDWVGMFRQVCLSDDWFQLRDHRGRLTSNAHQAISHRRGLVAGAAANGQGASE